MSNRNDRTIAIDGPAASGKSTIAQHLASHLGFLYFDTGVMYRAATLAGLQSGIPIGDEARISEKAFEISIDVRPPSKQDGRQYDVIMDGDDVTWEIRTEAVDSNVSEVSAYPGVRQAMTERQREIGRRGGVVMVGRDIGTVVLPEADFKLYLDASVEARARRRYEERIARGEQVEYVEILEAMRLRDRFDSNRDLAPLRPADDAVIIDSTDLSISEVLERAVEIVQT
ncbi:MAG: (d)CMP kinase [Anaerolineales bacterium]